MRTLDKKQYDAPLKALYYSSVAVESVVGDWPSLTSSTRAYEAVLADEEARSAGLEILLDFVGAFEQGLYLRQVVDELQTEAHLLTALSPDWQRIEITKNDIVLEFPLQTLCSLSTQYRPPEDKQAIAYARQVIRQKTCYTGLLQLTSPFSRQLSSKSALTPSAASVTIDPDLTEGDFLTLMDFYGKRLVVVFKSRIESEQFSRCVWILKTLGEGDIEKPPPLCCGARRRKVDAQALDRLLNAADGLLVSEDASDRSRLFS